MRKKPPSDKWDIPGIFRDHRGKIMAALSFYFGVKYIDLIEDIIQETFYAALKAWPTRPPQDPVGWLLKVSRNKAINEFKKLSRLSYGKVPFETGYGQVNNLADDIEHGDYELGQLKMLTCLSGVPNLSGKKQLMLILKLVCGFDGEQIAQSLLMNREAVFKNLQRIIKTLDIRELKRHLETSSSWDLETVHRVIYLLFNMGFQTSREDYEKGRDLCEQAIHLAHLLENKKMGNAETMALLSLMYFNLARFDNRVGEKGELLLLWQQDRSGWDPKMIALGFEYLRLSRQTDKLTVYHLEAGIAAVHCTYQYDQTDWEKILWFYDQILLLKDDPVVRLNRLIPFYHIHGPQKALSEMKILEDERDIKNYHLFYATKGEFERLAGNDRAAIKSFHDAHSLSKFKLERDFLQTKIAGLGG